MYIVQKQMAQHTPFQLHDMYMYITTNRRAMRNLQHNRMGKDQLAEQLYLSVY